MIELLNAKISLEKNAPKINTTINFGVSYFDATCKNIFDFLSLKNQVLVDGSFLINGKSFSSDEGNNLFAFKISSQVLNTLCVFQLDELFSFKQFNSFKKELIALRPLNIETESEKQYKIDKIIEIIIKYKPIYIMIDFNDAINRAFADYLFENLGRLKASIQYVFVLANKEDDDKSLCNVYFEEKGNIEETKIKPDVKLEEPEEANTVSSTSEKYEKYEKEFSSFNKEYKIPTVKKNKQGEQTTNFFGEIIKNQNVDFTFRFLRSCNWYILFLILFGIVLGFSSIASSVFLNTDKVGLGVLLVCSTILFMILAVYIMASVYAGLKKYMNINSKKVISICLFETFVLIGIILGFVLNYAINAALKSNETSSTLTEMIPFIIFTVCVFVLTLFTPFFANLYIKFKTRNIKEKTENKDRVEK